MKDDTLYLVQMKECLELIETYVEGGRALVDRDRKTRDAVLRNLQTMTESSQRLSEAYRAAHDEIDWRGVAGFRNVLVHEYLAVNADRIWKIIEEDLPPLRALLKGSLKVSAEERLGGREPQLGRQPHGLHIHALVVAPWNMRASSSNGMRSLSRPYPFQPDGFRHSGRTRRRTRRKIGSLPKGSALCGRSGL